jgi:2-polyprenyl-6-methoxyphenol hydroxylase-like FAD-dependent oxidoreductase
MNTGIQDAVDLGHTLIDVVGGQAESAALDGYGQRRRPVAEQVMRLTDRATRLATLQGRMPRHARNLAISIASRIPAVQRRLALQIAELPETR